jgi:CSLREA domain-containing protein
MKTRNLLISLLLGLGLTLVFIGVLEGGVLVAHATSIVVQTPLDGMANDHKCTLREAIIAANTDASVDTCAAGVGADSIALKQDTYALTVAGSGEDLGMTGDLDIAASLTIVGAGPDKTFIDANGLDRVFDILSGAGTVVLSDLTIINGNVAGAGGGIRSDDADLTLINVKVINNTASGSLPDGRGGGVFIDDGSLLLDGGQILSNTAGVWGGGVHVHGAATIFTQTGSTTIAHNHSNDEGGGLSISSARATIIGGQVFSNTADGDGGGVYTRSSDTILNMTDVEIIENYAAGYSGGIEVYDGGVTVSGGQVISNTAGSSGGGVRVTGGEAVLTQTGASLIAHNNAGIHAGGVFVLNGSAKLNGGQILSNTANYRAGGIYVENDGNLTLVNVTISGNKATEQYGGGIRTSGALTMTHTTIASNTAAYGGGGINKGSSDVVLLQNTIVAHNTPVNCNTGLTSAGYNLDSDTSCGLNATGDITNTDPLLGPLTNDGGVWVHPLLEGSPAIDAGNPAFVPPPEYDQRGPGFPRLIAGRVDIGSYEATVSSLFTYLPLVLKN